MRSSATAWHGPCSSPTAVQEISARIGRTTGQGLAGNISRLYPSPVVYGLVALLLIANVINIGANLGAMGEALGLLIGGRHLVYVLAFGFVCAAVQIFLKYTRYVSVLKWLTLVLFAYVVARDLYASSAVTAGAKGLAVLTMVATRVI